MYESKKMRRKVTQSRISRAWPTAIDIFSGAGAVSAALKKAHFRVVAAIDNDEAACKTYRLNHPKVFLCENDIQKIDPATIQKECLIPPNSVDLMVICAPCQPFSNQNRNRKHDPQRLLLLEAARFVSALKPKVLFVENVPGIASDTNTNLLLKFQKQCGAEYQFSEPLHVNAADYCVPQRRIRCLLLAAKGQPAPSLPQPSTPVNKRLTVRHTISGLKSLSSGEHDESDPLHIARNHRPIALKRLRHIPKNGGSRKDLPRHLRLKCHRKTQAYPDVYGRMAWDDIAPTLTTGCTDITRGRFAHPDENRAITLREAALLQTFPRNYRFTGSPTVIAQQIGNAVPYALVRALVPTFRRTILKK